jgi:CheY-like chemotaxis protein
VLVVDDEPLSRRIAAEGIKQAGLKVAEAGDG